MSTFFVEIRFVASEIVDTFCGTLDIPVCSDHSEYCSHSDESCNSIHKKSNYVDNTTSDCCLSSDEEFTVGSIYN